VLARRLSGPATVIGLIALAVVAALQIPTEQPPSRRGVESRPERVMSTTCRLIAVPHSAADTDDAAAAQALHAAEAQLRQVEAQLSSFIEASILSRLNRAPAGEAVQLPAMLLGLLRTSQQLYAETQGAFDITCGPLIALWRAAGTRGKLPSEADLAAARQASSWQALELGSDRVTKRAASARIDLGAIAKGYGIDRAVKAMRDAGMCGGLIDVGGDLRVFGTPPQGEKWEVSVQNPLGRGTIVTLSIRSGAVCTSGSYHRYSSIGGRRFSHIVDPRSGRPAEGVASATVLARDATTADGWATAVAVLGEAGLELLPDGVEALLIVGSQQAPRARVSPGLNALITQGPPYPTLVMTAAPRASPGAATRRGVRLGAGAP
jgi:thiamine biosynthesis lipoprotein